MIDMKPCCKTNDEIMDYFGSSKKDTKRRKELSEILDVAREAERKRILEKVREKKKYWIKELEELDYARDDDKQKERGRISELEWMEKLLGG